MTDYSKPIGWWCLDCGSVVSEGADLDDCDVHEMGHREIPVFAVIPEGERPETNEPEGGDHVCLCLSDGSRIRGRFSVIKEFFP